MNKNTKQNILPVAIIVVLLFACGFLTSAILNRTQVVTITNEAASTEKQETWTGQYMQVLVDPFNQEETLQGWGDEVVFGDATGMRPSNFKTTLARGLSATASTSEEIFVSSLTTKDSHTLDSSDIGDNVCFHVNPGASNDEIVCCTAINTTNVSFTGCTRGYNFYSTSTTSGNAKPHSAGETVIISNDDHYLSTQYPQLDSPATITGLWTFGGENIASIQFGSGNSTYDKRIYIYNGDANKPFISYDESENAWVISNNGVDTTTIGATGGGYTAGDGIILTASDFDVNITSASGLYFSSDEYLAIYASTSNPLYIDDDGQVSLNSSASYAFGSLTLETALDELYGGTGSISWDKSDVVIATADNTLGNVASGTEDYLFSMSSGVPAWVNYAKYQNRLTGLNTTWTSQASANPDLQSVASISVPANVMGANGLMDITIRGVTPNVNGTGGIQVKWNEGVIASKSIACAAGEQFELKISIWNKNATNSQDYRAIMYDLTSNTFSGVGITTNTIDTTAATTLEVLFDAQPITTETGTVNLINVEAQYSD